MLPHSAAVFAELSARHPDVPGIHFGVNNAHLLEAMQDAGSSIMGVDSSVTLREVRQRLGSRNPHLVLQGNLNPERVLEGPEQAIAATDEVLESNSSHPGHIFNLGHGVTPQCDPDILHAVVRHVHERTSQ